MTRQNETTSQKHAKLKQLSQAAKDSIYDMLRLTQQILDDHKYVDQFGGEGPMLERLEQDEYSHFGGQPSLPAMLRAYRANPEKATWKEYGYNLRVMIDLATPERERGESQRVNWKSRCHELEEKLNHMESSLQQHKAEAEKLRERCDALVSANGELRGQLRMLRDGNPVGVD